MRGRLSLNLVKSAKWGEEIHIQVYGKGFEVERRNPSEWSRVEIYFPAECIRQLLDALADLLGKWMARGASDG